MTKLKQPAGLGAAGQRTWRGTLAAFADDWAPDERDLLILEQAARQSDLIAELEAALKTTGIVTTGAAGQDRLNGAVSALVQARALLARLLAQVEIRPPAERTGHLNRRQRNQLADARRARWSRGGVANG